jgi:hypothetical protein
MPNNQYNAIVVGGGIAGVACAAEMTLLGMRPLLVCETKEVGSTLRSCWVGSNRGIQQHPEFQVGWGGGWWYKLVRRMDIPVKLHPSHPLTATVVGDWTELDIPILPSASGITDLICAMQPAMEEIRAPLHRLIHQGLMIPYEELCDMTQVSMEEWLLEQGAEGAMVSLVLSLITNLLAVPIDDAKELSVFGGWGGLRTMVCGEGMLVVPDPDPREGLCVPIAHAVERYGGEIWRGRKVANVVTDGGRATGIVMEDGTEASAPAVAIATGNPRIPAILDPLPPEVAEAVAYSQRFVAKEDLNVYSVLEREVVKRDRLWIVMDTDGSNLQWSWPIHSYPWTTTPGKNLTAAIRTLPPGSFDSQGGIESVVTKMNEVDEHLWPGFIDAIEDYGVLQHKHHWSAPQMCGPKMPRVCESVPGLYFVGDGSIPIGGFFVESAASAGMMGAHAIKEALVPA